MVVLQLVTVLSKRKLSSKEAGSSGLPWVAQLVTRHVTVECVNSSLHHILQPLGSTKALLPDTMPPEDAASQLCLQAILVRW
jgi:hypothetical protein